MEYVQPRQLHIVHIRHLITFSDPAWTDYFFKLQQAQISLRHLAKKRIVECKSEA